MTWFYEQREGLTIYGQVFEGAKNMQVTLTWQKLCAAVDRHRKIKAAKKRKRC